ncbi:helix-turn-helix domain-containing protein [Streptomyces sp. NPDC054950]
MASTPSPRWVPLPIGLGNILRGARIAAGLSRDALAEAVGASKGVVQAIEEELRPPSVEVAERLSDVLRLGLWEESVLLAVAVETGQLRSRRGVRHVQRRGLPLPLEVAERIAFERAAGCSWRAIAAALNAAGTPTVQGGSWWASSVSRAAADASGGS